MLELLKVEWLKVRRYRTFWIFTILYFVSIAGINYIGYYLNESAVKNLPASEILIGAPFGFPRVWATVGFMSSWLLYFPGILFIMLLGNEFNFRTHRQNIIDGWERRQFLNVKFLFALLFSMVATIFNAVVAFAAGMGVSGTLTTWDGLHHVVYIFVQTFSYIAFAMLLAILMRRSGAAIAVFFLYGLIFEGLLMILINFKMNAAPLGYFLPLQVTDSLLPLPFGQGVLYQNGPEEWKLVLAAMVYLALYFWLTHRRFARDDL